MYNNAFEELNRLMTFEQVDNMIEEHNQAGVHTYTLGHNQFSDWTPEELQFLFRKEVGTPELLASSNETVEARAPCQTRFIKNGGLQRIKYQMKCGSCWAFAATAALESAHWDQFGVLYDLSDMQVACCAMGKKRGGCAGGNPIFAYLYAQNKAITLTEEYPYCDACEDPKCPAYLGKPKCLDPKVPSICSDQDLQKGSVQVDQIKTNLLPSQWLLHQDHVLAVGIKVGDQFISYKSGIFTGSTTYKRVGIHAFHEIAVVGYGRSADNEFEDIDRCDS